MKERRHKAKARMKDYSQRKQNFRRRFCGKHEEEEEEEVMSLDLQI